MNTRDSRTLSAWVALVLMPILFPTTALADSATATIDVSATVLKSCAVSTTALAFGEYTPSNGTASDATSTISVTCTNGTTYEIALDAGAGSGATVSSRKMTYLTNTLTYELFRDSARLLTWGDTTLINTVVGVGDGEAASHTVYGRIAAGQYEVAGSYSDTVTVTVTY